VRWAQSGKDGAAHETTTPIPKTENYSQTVAESVTTLALILTAAGIFDAGIYLVKGFEPALDFVAGFLIEESLSVDNLFVFLLLFDYFQVPLPSQSRVLRYGILGAVVLRGLFIGLGVVALESFRPILLVFSAILIFSSFKLLVSSGDDDEEDISENKIVQLATRLVDATDQYDGEKFFTTVQVPTDGGLDGGSGSIEKGGGKAGGQAEAGKGFELVRKATPLLLVLVCIELCDLVFAVDSVPAVFGVTEDPLIVFSSNMFAILSLRSIYSILADAVEALPYLEPAVAIILGFVGVKLNFEYFGYLLSTEVSLGVIVSLLAGGVGASYLFPPPEKKEGDGDVSNED